MQTIAKQDILPVEIQLSGSQYTKPEIASPPGCLDEGSSERKLSFYKKTRTFDDANIESVIQKKVRNTIAAGLECSSIVQELVLGHAEDEEWQSRRKEYFRGANSARKSESRLKSMQCRNPLVTILDNVVFGSSRYFKRLFAA